MAKRLMKAEEEIRGLAGATVGDFWSWAYSDLVSNTIRPLFAEYLVGRCLGVVSEPRVEWDHVDFVYAGKKIEVKSSGYVQTWKQRDVSVISFDISSKKRPWIAESNTYGEAGRCADCYVFCVHAELDAANCCVTDTGQWEFYALPCSTIATAFGSQSTTRLSRIRKLCSAVAYEELKSAIDAVLGVTPESG
jgi:hypothetical protein